MIVILVWMLCIRQITCLYERTAHVHGGNRILQRHPRDVDPSYESVFGNAVYFHGNEELLKLSPWKQDSVLPNDEFTLQLWISPDGGQYRHTPIVDVINECNQGEENGWTVGITLPSFSREDARIFFSFYADGSSVPTTLLAHRPYDVGTWTNVAVTFDGHKMTLYVNGAGVASVTEHPGGAFRRALTDCAGLYVGGRLSTESYYRGKIDELKLWGKVLSQREIVEYMNILPETFQTSDDLIIYDSFDDFNNWEFVSDFEPVFVESGIALPYHTVRLEAPPCGKTVCDDPEVVFSYMNNTQLRRKKIINYRVINIYDDFGKNPVLSETGLSEQHIHLAKAFEPYNIELKLEQIKIKNTTLTKKVFMFDCHPYQIGNGICDEMCAHSTTGNDGGDCDHVISECKKALLGNGLCNTECNKAYHDYDDGDCCKPGDENTYQTCIDPQNPHRGYMHVEELKMGLQLDGREAVNIFLVTSSWNREAFHGIATYPWEKNVYTSMGGIIMHVNVIGRPDKMKNLVHEFGHVFGLWHVHRGISEMSCDDPCRETHPSMVLGDLCSDTRPTPRNSQCMDPRSNTDSCDNVNFYDTPYRNYMSYADDNCIDHFTSQQEARMHCYLDLVYQPMREMEQPTPVPVSPKIIQADDDTVNIAWLTPLGLDTGCDGEQALHQYADVATSSHTGVRWSPHEATGFPDAEKCTASRYAWKPYHSNIHPGCDFDSCWIELGFKEPVIADRISLWVADIRDDTAVFIELITDADDVISVGDVPVYCDQETTIKVSTHKPVVKVKLYTEDSYIAIDAVELVSKPKFPSCLDRQFQTYKVVREPEFAEGYIIVNDNKMADRTVKRGETYTYTVQTLVNARLSVESPSLVYTHGSPFCGDGIVQSDETCDDKNAVDGDGCTMECQQEEGFTCTGSPSLCMYYLTDDCDNTQRVCDVTAPAGFYDQWAVRAVANPEYQTSDCPTSLMTGPRENIQKCASRPVETYWRPCGELLDVSGDFWIDVYIYKPVVATAVILHLASDGRSLKNIEKKQMHIQLILTDDTYHNIEHSSISVTCEQSPILLPVTHDLSQPFVLTKGVRISFTSSSIGLYAVRIRASPYINPVGIQSCSNNELYDTKHGVCVSDKCSRAKCDEFPVKHGVAVCTGSEHGDSCKIDCNDGYFVDGHENKAQCVDGSWVSSSHLTCSPVVCGKPYVPMATVVCSDGLTYSKSCNFKCDKPAIGTGDDTTLTCLRSGKWSTPKSACVIQCKELEPVAYSNGKLKTTSCIKGPQHIGQQCKVRCDEGFHVQGGRTKRRFLRIVCDDFGEWYGPKCVPNTCPPISRLYEGAYTCTDDFNSGSVCSMNCPDDLSLYQEVKCGKNGEWDKTFSICPSDSQKSCHALPTSKYFKFTCEHSRTGGECIVQCGSKGYIPIHRPVRTWNQPVDKSFEYIDNIVCTVLQKWEPAPRQIECVQKCLEKSISDGFCDADNNREVCEWDGGDCCPSTVQWGVVLPIPEDCVEDCSCKDPTAIENRRRSRRHKHGYWLI